MKLPRLAKPAPLALLAICATLAACDSGPKTYDDCMLLASRNSESDRQFKMMANSCKDRFGHTLPLRPPPTEASKAGEPPTKRP
jgi:hypothetical protein